MPPRDDTTALALAFRQGAAPSLRTSLAAPPDPDGEDTTLALAAAFQARSQAGAVQTVPDEVLGSGRRCQSEAYRGGKQARNRG